MARKGENIYKRKDGRWEGRYIKAHDEFGKAKYGYVYGKSYREVKDKRNREQDASSKPGPSPQPCVSFESLLDEWLTLNKEKNKESTYVKYYNLIYRHIIPSLGGYPVAQLSTRVIQSFARDKMDRGRLDKTGGLSEKTVKDILGIIQASLNFARMEHPQLVPAIKMIYPKESVREIRVLTRREQAILEQFLLREPDLSKLGVYFSLYTGLRLGEICALRWEDILFQEAVLKVRRTIQRIQNIGGEAGEKTKVVLSPPKSRCSFREIPLMDLLIERIRPFRPQSPERFFLTSDPNKFMEPRTYQNRFQSYLRQCGLEGVNFHALRHTFATRCVEAGFEIKSLSEILGHSNVNLTLMRYVHSSRSLKRANMNKLTGQIMEGSAVKAAVGQREDRPPLSYGAVDLLE